MHSFPRLLRSAGYRTAAVGKMHFAPTYLDIGFDEMVLAEQNGPGRYHDDYHRYLYDRNLIDYVDSVDQINEIRQTADHRYWERLGAVPSILPEEHSSSRWISDRALEQIDRWGSEPNLLVAGFIKPHHPFDPPEPWASMYDPDELHLVPGYRDTPDEHDMDYDQGFFPHSTWNETALRGAMAGYYGSISQIDHEVGRITERLKANGRYENTLFVYFSDHGEYLGFRHLLLKGGQLYDPLMRVPLVVRPPRGTADGAGEDDRLVSLVDIAPTVLGACGLDVPREVSGLDFLSDQERECLFAEGSLGDTYMVRTRQRKLILQKNDAHSRFYDLEADPHESQDLYRDGARSDEVATLRERLIRWRLFESVPPARIDLNAPQTRFRWDGAPAVPPEAMRAYVARRVTEIAEE